jgi:hypothetical protein
VLGAARPPQKDAPSKNLFNQPTEILSILISLAERCAEAALNMHSAANH